MESFSINNTESFRQLYSRYYKALMLYAMKMTEDEETAEDIVQNVFLHLWENREIFDDENVVRNFLYLSVRRRAIDQQDVNEDVKGTLTTRHDKEFWMTLPDGTRVHLNGNSRLSYPLAFKGDLREVALVGEAYFIVAKDKDHPFIVHTADGDIKEYGTEFNVSTHGTNTEVVLVTGSLSRYESIDNTLDVISSIANVKMEQQDNKIVIH